MDASLHISNSNQYLKADIKNNVKANESTESIENVFGKQVDNGKKTTRLALQLFEDDQATQVRIAIKELPLGAKGEKMLKSYQSSWLKKLLWAPLQIKTADGSLKTILVNINSVAKRLGISKTLMREAIKQDLLEPELARGRSLAKLLNKMKAVKEASKKNIELEETPSIFDSAAVIKIVNFMEKKRGEWAFNTHAKADMKPISYSHGVHPIPYKIDVFEGKAFIFLGKIGEGGFKNVFVGFDYNDARKVALATLKPIDVSASKEKEKKDLEILEKEAKVNLGFGDKVEGLVKTYKVVYVVIDTFGVKTTQPVIMQKYYSGTLTDLNSKESNSSGQLTPRLETLSKAGSVMPISSRVKMMKETGNGIAYLHGKGFVHRDIKPDNIFIDLDEMGVPTADCGDFGLSASRDDKDFLDRFPGSHNYMSPELGKEMGKYENTLSFDRWKKNDVWGLGCVWFEMLLGYSPDWMEDLRSKIQEGESGKWRKAIVSRYYSDMVTGTAKAGTPKDTYYKAIERLPSGPIGDLISRMLSINPKDRPTMPQVMEAMAKIQGGDL